VDVITKWNRSQELAPQTAPQPLAPPELTTTTEDEWKSFEVSLIRANQGGSDTQVSAMLHFVGDSELPLDIRKRALYALSGIDAITPVLGMSLSEGWRRSDGSFEKEAKHILDDVFAAEPLLRQYGVELGLNLLSAKDDSVLAKYYEAGLLLSAGLANSQDDPVLCESIINTMTAKAPKYSESYLSTNGILRGAASILADPRVQEPQKRDLINGLASRWRNGFSVIGLSEEIAVALAFEELDDTIDHQTDFLQGYLNGLCDRPEVWVTSRNYLQHPPVGLENIHKLEQVLGADHRYIKRIVGSCFITSIEPGTSYGYADSTLDQALSAINKVQNPELQKAARTVVLEKRSKNRVQFLEREANRKAANLAVNEFLHQAKKQK